MSNLVNKVVSKSVNEYPNHKFENFAGPVAHAQAWLDEVDDGKAVQLDLF